MTRRSEPVFEPRDGPLSRMEWDVARGHAVVHLADGSSAGMPVSMSATDEEAGIAHMVYSFTDHTLTLTATDGERATMEIESPGGSAQLAGRRVVYLDQGHWSTLSRHIHDPGSIAPQDALAADRLIGWVRDRRIILPLSSGHMIETTRLYGAKRQRWALAMLQLSRGWHMRNPLLVRYDEIARVLASASSETPGRDRLAVFTLETDSLYAASTRPEPDPKGLPEYLDWLGTRLTAVSANFAVLIDPERIEPEKARAAGWCGELAALGRDPEFRAMPLERRRVTAQARALMDALADRPAIGLLQRSSLPLEDAIDALLRGLQASTDTMPFLRLYADALGVRLLNPTTRWEANDLIDMLYLACAAAYADGVAAERTATKYLRAAWRDRSEPCPVVPTLRELVSHLTELGLA